MKVGSEEHVAALHHAYFTELKRIFEAHRGRAGYPLDRIVLEPPLEPRRAGAAAAPGRAKAGSAVGALDPTKLGKRWHEDKPPLGEYAVVVPIVSSMLILGFFLAVYH